MKQLEGMRRHDNTEEPSESGKHEVFLQNSSEYSYTQDMIIIFSFSTHCWALGRRKGSEALANLFLQLELRWRIPLSLLVSPLRKDTQTGNLPNASLA